MGRIHVFKSINKSLWVIYDLQKEVLISQEGAQTLYCYLVAVHRDYVYLSLPTCFNILLTVKRRISLEKKKNTLLNVTTCILYILPFNKKLITKKQKKEHKPPPRHFQHCRASYRQICENLSSGALLEML